MKIISVFNNYVMRIHYLNPLTFEKQRRVYEAGATNEINISCQLYHFVMEPPSNNGYYHHVNQRSRSTMFHTPQLHVDHDLSDSRR